MIPFFRKIRKKLAVGNNYGNRLRCLDLYRDVEHLIQLIDNEVAH